MMNAQRIVVGLDFEEDGDVALTEALRVSEASGAELHLVHVLSAGARNTEVLSRALEDAMQELRERVRRTDWPRAATFEIKLHVRFGDIVQMIRQVAVDYDAHMIVVGTHARRGVSRAVLGSVAESLARTAPVPVLVARTRNFEGLERTPTPAVGIPGADVHRTQIVSEAIRVGPRSSHISGLV
jgi:nucleotide-binding universal stress UspA family protein